MDKVGIVLLAIMGMLAWIALWVWVALVDWGFLPNVAITMKELLLVSLSSAKKTYIRGRLWLKVPQSEAQALRILTWVAAILFAGATWVSDADTELGNFRTEATGIAIAVIFIEEVSRRRTYLERKQEMIQQMASRNNDFALDATRIARNEGWLVDGSLQGANLRKANLQSADLDGAELQLADFHEANLQRAHLVRVKLQHANLQEANLQGADLFAAHLQGASLVGAKLQGASLREADLQGASLFGAEFPGAKYTRKTNWPDDFDPCAAGAILVEI